MSYTPLISYTDAQAFGSFVELTQNSEVWGDDALEKLMVTASRSIEQRCDRRLAAFTDLVESSRADGVDIDGMAMDDVPLDLVGSLGRSRALAYGATSLVRDVWLREYAPILPDLWAGQVTQIELIRAYGDSEIVNPANIEGPQWDTGHLRFRLGTFVPPGTTLLITYSGGYDPVPDDLAQACIFQAMKLVLVGAEPELREGMSSANLDEELLMLLAPYIRY